MTTPIISVCFGQEAILDILKRDSQCPREVVDAQMLVDVTYESFDGTLHRGQLVIHRDLIDDIQTVFALARDIHFPITSVIPIIAFGWDDATSMQADNTSAFNYRVIDGTTKLSSHALGRAIDINPRRNPWVRAGKPNEPIGATYDPKRPGTFTRQHPIVGKFMELGWEWGGDWVESKDYQHFQKP